MKTVAGSSITGPILRRIAGFRIARWDELALKPQPIQVETLRGTCRRAAGTEFGCAHGFAGIRSYEEFRERVPLRSYAEFEPYLQRMRRGERDVLWPGLIRYYGQSSGTSHTAALHKFLPISDEQIRWQQRAGFDVVARYLDLSGDRSFTGGFSLGLFPPAVIKPDGPVGVTSNPGLMMRKLPAMARLISLPRSPIKEIEDYDQKLDAIAAAYLDHDVRALSGTTCWFSIFFERLLAAARKQGRAAATVSEIWPNLRALFGGGVHAGPYRKLIEQMVGRPVHLIDNYNATEGGILAATDKLDDGGMLVIPDRGVFFEFVPRAEHGKPDATRLPLWEVEPGGEYSVVLTTRSGLFGYVIGDFVRFLSVFPHRLVFAGRSSGMLSLTQELMTNLEVESAVTAAAEAQACTMVDYTAASEVGVNGSGKGRYLLFAEFAHEPQDLAAFARALDSELCKQNRVYREHRREDVAILPPSVVPLARGATRAFMEALGQTSVQNKFPRILDEARRDVLRKFARPN